MPRGDRSGQPTGAGEEGRAEGGGAAWGGGMQAGAGEGGRGGGAGEGNMDAIPSFLLPGSGAGGRPLAAARADAVAALEAVLRAGEEEGLAEEEEVESLMLEQLHAELEAAAGGIPGGGRGAGRGREGGAARDPQSSAAALVAAAAAAGVAQRGEGASPADLELMLREVSRMFQQESGVLERFLAELRAARGPPS